MLRLSRQVDYGVRFLVQLSRQGEELPLSIRQFAEHNGVSFLFMQRVVGDLRRAGLVKASRGSQGGYYLACNPTSTNVLDVYRALEGDAGILPCMSGGCAYEENCVSKNGMHGINWKISQLLYNTKLNDF